MSPNQLATQRPQHIEEAITGVERYNPENLPQLEEYLGLQCRSGQYDLISNLAILELYQFNPSLINLAVITTILGKSLTALPDADFDMFLSLLNPTIPLVKNLLDLQRLLEECRYKEFWALLASKECKEVLGDIKNFDKDIRKVISSSLETTFDTLEKNIVKEYLNFDDDELTAFTEEKGWKFSDNDLLFNPSAPHVESKPQTVQQHQIKLEQLSKIIAQSNY
ncbi:ARM repeat-containing protein [Neoconidiobolus thromboides FSU 785]|nr:ARM repeat-containing protein [Neoconidiobolus thromboides FSU 785]